MQDKNEIESEEMIEIRFNCNMLWEKYIFSARCWLGKGKGEEWKVVSLWVLERDNRQNKEKRCKRGKKRQRGRRGKRQER